MNLPATATGITALRRVLHTGMAAAILVLSFSAHNSGLLKLPLLVLTSSLLVGVYAATTIKQRNLVFVHSSVDIPVVLFLLLTLVSGIFTEYHNTLQGIMLLASCVIVFFATTIIATRQADVAGTIGFICVLGGVVCVGAGVQYFLDERLPVHFFLGDRRVGSTLGSPAFLGGFCALLLPIVIGQTLTPKASTKRKRWMTLLAVALAGTLLLTLSRSSIIAGLIGTICFLILQYGFQNRRVVWAGFAIAGIVVTGLLLVPNLGERFLEIFGEENISTLTRRMYFWEAGWRAFIDSPLFGHGVGSWEQVMMAYRSPDYWIAGSEDIVPHAHNEFLEIAVETGLLGLGLFTFIIGRVTTIGMRIMRHGNESARYTTAGLLAGIGALLVDNMVNVSLRQPPVAAAFWLVMGLLVSNGLGKASRKVSVWATRIPQRLVYAPILLWALFAVAVGWHYWTIVQADSHLMRGILTSAGGNPSTAIDELVHATRLDPRSPLSLSQLALEYLKAQQPEKALEILDRLDNLYPNFPKSAMMRTLALHSLNRTDEALASIHHELQRRNHPQAFFLESHLFKTLGRREEEYRSLVQMMEASLRAGKLHNVEYGTERLVKLSEITGQRQDVLDLFKKLARRFPEEQHIAKHLALLRPDS